LRELPPRQGPLQAALADRGSPPCQACHHPCPADQRKPTPMPAYPHPSRAGPALVILAAITPAIFLKTASNLVHIGRGVATAGGNAPAPGGWAARSWGCLALGLASSSRFPWLRLRWSWLSPLLEAFAVVILVHAGDHRSSGPPRRPIRLIIRIAETKSEEVEVASAASCCIFSTSPVPPPCWFLHQGEHIPHARIRLGHSALRGWKGCRAPPFRRCR